MQFFVIYKAAMVVYEKRKAVFDFRKLYIGFYLAVRYTVAVYVSGIICIIRNLYVKRTAIRNNDRSCVREVRADRRYRKATAFGQKHGAAR